MTERETPAAATSSTSQEGEWELRDGKFFRKSTKTISAAQPQRVTVCQACPQKDREIIQLKSTVKQLQDVLASRDTMITSMRERIEKFELDARNWVTERSRFESTITSLNRTIEELRIQIKAREDWVSRTILMEKETIINNLQIRIRQLEQELENAGRHVIVIREKETHINNLQQRIRQLEGDLDGANRGLALLREKETIISQLEIRIRDLEGQLEYCKTNHTDKKPEPPPVVHTRWYYAVQNQQHAHLFQQHPRYQGGEVVVDSLEGATVVNPEYYTQSERVPGNARLRVRVVDATGVPTLGLGNLELFVRMRLGTATQFTQPRPISFPNVMWQQDFVFVGVPLTAHTYYTAFFVPQNPLIFELVGRIIGTSQEQIIGTGQAELSDLIVGLTRTIVINLDHGGAINVRIKALDFGLPNPEDQQANLQVQQTIVQPAAANVRTSAVTTTYNVSNQELARKLDASDGAIDGHYGAAKINVTGGGVSTGAVVGKTTYNVSDAEMARRLDASDGVIDGKYGQANINVRSGSASGVVGGGAAVSKTTYNVSSEEMARRLDAADGKIDGRFNNANINVKH